MALHIPHETSRLLFGAGVIAGFAAEGRIADQFGPVEIGGSTHEGAEAAAVRLCGRVSALLSFGLAGGLGAHLQPGALVVPSEVLSEGERFAAHPGLVQMLGGPTVDLVLGSTEVAPSSRAKRQLGRQTGAAAIDTESGAVARVARRYGLPFAVLRAVCDPAERSLPASALVAIDQNGSIRVLRVLASVAAAPSQIPALIQLARDAVIARRALIRRVAELRDGLPLM